MKKYFALIMFAILLFGCRFPNFSVPKLTEKSETLIPDSILGVWKVDDMRAPDKSWKMANSVYIEFIDTKQNVYLNDDAFNNDRPSDSSDIVYSKDSTFIKKMTDNPEHPEYVGKFQKWTWRTDNGNVLFTIYGLMDTQDLALSDETITVLATGVKMQESQKDDGKAQYALKCNITAQEYGFEITGESGQIEVTFNDETTKYNYDDSGVMTGMTLAVNRDLLFTNSQHKYHIEGTITVDQTANEVTYDITATGELFGDSPQTCKKP